MKLHPILFLTFGILLTVAGLFTYTGIVLWAILEFAPRM